MGRNVIVPAINMCSCNKVDCHRVVADLGAEISEFPATDGKSTPTTLRPSFADVDCRWLGEKVDTGELRVATTEFAENLKLWGKLRLLDLSKDMRRDLFDNLRDLANESLLRDPDLWPWVNTFFKDSLNHFWDDCQHEIDRKIELAALKKNEADSEDTERLGPKLESAFGACWCRARAFVLYHYLPFNKSFFGKSRDPVFLAMFVLAMLPIHGLRAVFFSVLLLFLVFPNHLHGYDHPDEHQLINFILMCKGTAFFSQGICLAFLGSMQYFRCQTWQKDSLLSCIEAQGPGSGSMVGQLFEFFWGIALVWTAFLLLKRWSRNKRASEKRMHAAMRHAFLDGTPGNPQEHSAKTPGGRMWNLLFYDIKCFVVSLMVLILFTALTCGGDGWFSSPQFRANLYWCKVLYSVTSLPFGFFTIPFFQLVLTHSTRTGFNEHGACVMWDYPVKRRPPKEVLKKLLSRRRRLSPGGPEPWPDRARPRWPSKAPGEASQECRRPLLSASSPVGGHSGRTAPATPAAPPQERDPALNPNHIGEATQMSGQVDGDSKPDPPTPLKVSNSLSYLPPLPALAVSDVSIENIDKLFDTSKSSRQQPTSPALDPQWQSRELPPPSNRKDAASHPDQSRSMDEPKVKLVCTQMLAQFAQPPNKLAPAPPKHSAKVQWMWADAGMIAGSRLCWSILRPHEEAAAQLEARGGGRPVQIRWAGHSNSQTFRGPHEAAQWIRYQGLQ